MGSHKFTLVELSGIDAANGSIAARIAEAKLRKMRADIERIIEDRVVTDNEWPTMDALPTLLADVIALVSESANFGASASNKAHRAEINIKRGAAMSLYGEPEDRAECDPQAPLNLLVFANYQANKNGASIGPDGAA